MSTVCFNVVPTFDYIDEMVKVKPVETLWSYGVTTAARMRCKERAVDPPRGAEDAVQAL